MARQSNGWTAVRPNWTGTLGMYWVHGKQPPPLKQIFHPSTWKPNVPGKTYPGFSALGGNGRKATPGGQRSGQ